MRLSSWRLARRAGRNGDSRARLSDTPGPRGPVVVTRVCCGRRLGRGGQALGERLSGCSPPECLARPTVQRRRDSVEFLGAVASEAGASGEVLAQQPVGVLVGPALPRASWITEIDLQTGIEPQLDVLGHLDPLVPGQRPPKLFGKRPDRLSDRITNGAGAGTRDRRAGLHS